MGTKTVLKIKSFAFFDNSRFTKLSRNLTHSRQPENFLSSQRFQDLGYDFIFTSSFLDFIPFFAVATSAAVNTSFSPKCITFWRVTSRCIYWIQKIFEVFPPS